MSHVGTTEKAASTNNSITECSGGGEARRWDREFFVRWFKHAAELVAVASVYIAVAKLGLALASVNASATPVWPATGYALAMTLLLGYRMAPAIFAGALIANATTAGSIVTWLGIATGNTLESVAGSYLITRFADGLHAFETPAGVAKFALICFVPSTLISAAIGALSLNVTGYAPWSSLPAIGMTWWMGDLAGALVTTPAILLWTQKPAQPGAEDQSILVHVAAVIVGVIAFSPVLEQTSARTPLAFLAILPLMWAAMRCRRRDTASAALVLSAFAVWGTAAGRGPFVQATENDSFLLLVAFMIGVSVPSLALSAEAAVRRRDERHIKFILHELSHRSKNLLAVVQSMARQIGRRADSIESFQAGLAARLQAIAKTHDLLVQANWDGTGMGDLIRIQLAPFHNSAEVPIASDGPELRLSAKAAEHIGLALYELGTNAAKYGALSHATGLVRIKWDFEIDDTRTKCLRLIWQETGGPEAAKSERQGFGTLVLTKLVPASLGATATLNFEPKGVRWVLLSPAASVIC